MSQGQLILINSFLKEFGFIQSFKPRRVNSIYFDDFDFSCLRDNIDGNPNRDKLRVRYYNSSFNSAKIEIKHKRKSIGYKSVFKLNSEMLSEKMVINSAKIWCKKNILTHLIPSAFVYYNRSYYQSNWLRATVDLNINSGRIGSYGKSSSSMINYEVLEFKYDVAHDKKFRDFYKFLNKYTFRNTKSSKYSNALMY